MRSRGDGAITFLLPAEWFCGYSPPCRESVLWAQNVCPSASDSRIHKCFRFWGGRGRRESKTPLNSKQNTYRCTDSKLKPCKYMKTQQADFNGFQQRAEELQ